MIEYGSGYIYINNQGYILEIATEKIEKPILQGIETSLEELQPGSRLCTEDLNKMSTVIKIMNFAESNEIANLITRIDIENDANYKILLESEEKVVYLGDSTYLDRKIQWVKKIIEETKNISGEILLNIDLNKNNPVFRQSV